MIIYLVAGIFRINKYKSKNECQFVIFQHIKYYCILIDWTPIHWNCY